jgi:hypothetical protein
MNLFNEALGWTADSYQGALLAPSATRLVAISYRIYGKTLKIWVGWFAKSVSIGKRPPEPLDPQWTDTIHSLLKSRSSRILPADMIHMCD